MTAQEIEETPTQLHPEELPTHISEDDLEFLNQALTETAPALAVRDFAMRTIFTKAKYKMNPTVDSVDSVTGKITRVEVIE